MFESSAIPKSNPRSIANAIIQQSRALSRGMARLLELIDTFDRYEGFREWGSLSTSQWVSWQCGVSRMTAREYVRVARALALLPTIRSAFAAGELSYAKVRAITRVATPETDATLASLASRSTATELERVVRRVRRGRAATDPSFARDNRSVTTTIDEEGMFAMIVRLPVADGGIVDAAVTKATKDESVSAETDEDLNLPTPGARARADALVLIARNFLAGSRTPTSDRSPYNVFVHVDPLESAIRFGETRLSISQAERILCDAAIARVEHRPGRRVGLWSSHQIVTPSLRKALLLRDRKCRFPGCENDRYLEPHHRRHWTRGGPTEADNLDLFCSGHHDFVHEKGCRVTKDASGRITVTMPDGTVLREIDYSRPPTEADATSTIEGRRLTAASMSGAS